MNIVILAAGIGKRMQSTLPKVLHRLAGQPLLVHVVKAARALSPTTLSVVIGVGAAAVKATLLASFDTYAQNICFILQTKQLGTGHAVRQALPFLDDTVPTLVLYGDVPLITPQTLQQLACLAGNDKLAILTAHLDDPTGYGRILRSSTTSAIVGIVEQKDASPLEQAIQECNTGILIVPTPSLKRWCASLTNQNTQEEYRLTDIVTMAVAQGMPVISLQPAAVWETLGVNDITQLVALERHYQYQNAQRLLAQGVRLADPARLDVRGILQCGLNCFIDVGCIFEGDVTLEEGVQVGAYCLVKDAHVGAHTQLHPFCHIESTAIAEHAQIGPYTRLRPGTVLAEGVRVGNFVEIKNSHISAQSKVNHLSYIGDATIGKDVNVGAGVITCNYDGAHKHHTIIEDQAFIGSDTQLVAPVRVGKKATLGAGTTLTKDAPAGQLTISRARQTSVEHWHRPVTENKEL